MNETTNEDIRKKVREGYGAVAERAGSCCAPSCCAPGSTQRQVAERAGYSEADLDGPAGEANLGLGCGNPTALANLKPGEVVVDLGAGAGFDALIAAPRVGPEGRVIGVDMTPQMLARARENAVRAGHAATVEFREGVIEDLPIASSSADVLISNCVINLSPDKTRVFEEAFRVLKPGGRIAVSDILLSEPLPEDVAGLVEAWVGCVGGALVADDYLGRLEDAGFVDVRFTRRPAAEVFAGQLDDPMVAGIVERIGAERVQALAGTVFSYAIEARKP